jgi:hypothetical protein
MLSRSKTAPLTIAFRQDDSRSLASLFDIFRNHPHRLYCVEITNISNPDILKLLATSTPILQSLVLRFQDPVLEESVELEVPSRLPRGMAPVLKYLKIFGFCIPQYDILPLASTLTHLYLNSPNPMHRRPPGVALLRVLHQSPVLETLVLLKYVSAEPYPSSRIDNPVECPSLRSLTLGDDARPALNFLNVVRIQEAVLHVAFTNEIDLHNDVPRFAETIGKARNINARLPLRALSIYDLRRDRRDLIVDLSFHEKTETAKHAPGFSLHFLQPLPSNLEDLVFTSLFTLVEERTMSSLALESEAWAFNQSAWLRFSASQSLKNIVFDCGADPSGFCTLFATGQQLIINGTTGPVFPSLSTLSLGWPSLQEGSPLRKVIVNALNTRPHHCRVKTLRVLHSGVECSRSGTAAHDFEISIPETEVIWVKD